MSEESNATMREDVTQADREAAADYMEVAGWPDCCAVDTRLGIADLESEVYDSEPKLIQAFARHRLAQSALAATRKVVDCEMVEVPRKPTEAMLCAGGTAGDHAVYNGMLHANADSVGLVWTAMIEAAPLNTARPDAGDES